MGVVQFAPAFVDEKVSRGHPCTAWRGDNGQRCGTTPTKPFHKTCLYGHDRNIWLCSTHEAMCFLHASTCRECDDRGGTVLAIVTRGG